MSATTETEINNWEQQPYATPELPGGRSLRPAASGPETLLLSVRHRAAATPENQACAALASA